MTGPKADVDRIQEQLIDYAYSVNYDTLPADAIRAAKVRVIDTLGALIGGFFVEPCRIARSLAAAMPNPHGATVLGTRMQTTPDMAAFVNGITARYAELTDVYHGPGSFGGHPSDVITAVLAAAEHAQVNGRAFITGVVLAYEVCLRISDVFHNWGYDHTNLACVGGAVAAGKLLGLSPAQLSHCIAMAIVPNNILRQTRLGESSMWKAAATGHVGRAAVFAAMLARAGMEGPHLPFEGKAGWCDHVARERFSLGAMGGAGTPFKILETYIKVRPAAGGTIPSVLAAEKIAPIDCKNISQVTVEVYKPALEAVGSGDVRWHPDTREAADHSIPYVVAWALMNGRLKLGSFNNAYLADPALRGLIKKIAVVENPEFTQGLQRLPQEHRARVTVLTLNGERIVGEAGGDENDMAAPMSDAQVEEKFRSLAEHVCSAKCVSALLDRLWGLENIENIAQIPEALVII